MFIKNIHGKEVINTKANLIGCTTGLAGEDWDAKPGIIGNTFKIKDQLKSAGARFDGDSKSWTFESWSALESAIDSIISA